VDPFGCLVVGVGFGIGIGLGLSLFKIVPLLRQREEWRRAAIDSERQLEWEHTEMVRVGDPVKWSTRR
jgi:hypothetical protein